MGLETRDVEKAWTRHDVPRHVAVIMDGNARWAEKRRLPPRVGHENGVESLTSGGEVCERVGD